MLLIFQIRISDLPHLGSIVSDKVEQYHPFSCLQDAEIVFALFNDRQPGSPADVDGWQYILSSADYLK